ncbi:MAG: PilZ domain-containing protein, partial [Myxococcales bacterium]|nr:PilZ domain-containing protein [Myxococcales bacterium]
MTEGHERRQYTRKVVDLPGEIQLGDAPRRPVRVTEMSLGGSFMETANVPPFGAELTAFFRLPGHTVEFALRSVVRWTSKTGMGVQFGTCSARETHALSLYLAARPPVPIPAQPARPRPALGLRALTTAVPQPSAPAPQGARAAA